MALFRVHSYGPAGYCGLAGNAGIGSSSTTVHSNISVSVSPSRSATVIVATPVPALTGVPEISRVAMFMATPAGRPEAV